MSLRWMKQVNKMQHISVYRRSKTTSRFGAGAGVAARESGATVCSCIAGAGRATVSKCGSREEVQGASEAGQSHSDASRGYVDMDDTLDVSKRESRKEVQGAS